MFSRTLLTLVLTFSITGCDDKDGGSSGKKAEEEVICSGEGLDGAAMYEEHCAECHERIDGARIGPNLVYAMPHHSDGFVLETINDGAETMPAYEGILSCDEQYAVLDYLREEYGECDASLWDWCD